VSEGKTIKEYRILNAECRIMKERKTATTAFLTAVSSAGTIVGFAGLFGGWMLQGSFSPALRGIGPGIPDSLRSITCFSADLSDTDTIFIEGDPPLFVQIPNSALE
jgi:hypothetical protein